MKFMKVLFVVTFLIAVLSVVVGLMSVAAGEFYFGTIMHAVQGILLMACAGGLVPITSWVVLRVTTGEGK